MRHQLAVSVLLTALCSPWVGAAVNAQSAGARLAHNHSTRRVPGIIQAAEQQEQGGVEWQIRSVKPKRKRDRDSGQAGPVLPKSPVIPEAGQEPALIEPGNLIGDPRRPGAPTGDVIVDSAKGEATQWQDYQYDAFDVGYTRHDFRFDRETPYQPIFGTTAGGWHVGGWLQAGYHSDSTGLFNDRPDNFNLSQNWLYLERRARTCDCAWDWGFRADVAYGIDGDNLQSFGNVPGQWDFQNGFDHGPDAWALPQLYGELTNGRWTLRGGHFLGEMTLERMEAPRNFFYSRSYSSVLAAPHTLTGISAAYDAGATTWQAGWSAGWDTGFDQFNEGSAFFGSVRRRLSDRATLAYSTSFGDLGRRGDGFAHVFSYDRKLGCRWRYAFETSFLHSNAPGNLNDNIGLGQYLIYRWSHKVDLGQRLEWWKSDINGAGSASTYAYTAGLTYRVNSNVRIRPEFRYNWGEQFNNADINEGIFGIDAIVRF